MLQQPSTSTQSCTLSFGLDSIIFYFDLIKRVEKLMQLQQDMILFYQIQSLLWANKILILNNIKDRQTVLKVKRDSQQEEEISFFELELLKKIHQRQLEIEQIAHSCQQKLKYPAYMKKNPIFVFIQSLRKTQIYRKNQMVKFQFYLRTFITKFVKEINLLTKDKWKEEEIALKERTLMVLDFLISFLQLNALLIENDNNWVKFGYQSQIQKATKAPLMVNLGVLKSIIRKVKTLNLNPRITISRNDC